MTRFALQPRWLAWHLLLVVVLVSFGWLGRWQLGTFEDKGGDAPTAGERRTVALDSRSRPGARVDPADLGRRVRATGTYDPAATLLVERRARPGGGGRGSLVVAMLRTDAGVLPVVRGWVPTPDDPAVAPPAGRVTVTGLLQRSEDEPARGAGGTGPGRLPYVATVTVLDALPYRADQLYDGFLALRSEDPAPGRAPVAVAAQPVASGEVGRWRNLAYALQWWVFAAAAVFFWWVVLRRAALEARQERQADRPPGPDAAGPSSLLAPRRTT